MREVNARGWRLESVGSSGQWSVVSCEIRVASGEGKSRSRSRADGLMRPSLQRVRDSVLLGEEVVEGFYGGEFVVFYVEDGVELGDVEDVLNFFGEAEEFEFAAGVADGGEAGD
jgi:hypothetical protein